MALDDRARVVVLRGLGLGDVLTAVPALRALADRFPTHRLVLAAPAALAPFVLTHDLAHAVVDVDLRAGAGPAPHQVLPAALAAADVAVNLHGSGPQSTRMLTATRPRRLLAFAHPEEPASSAGPRWIPEEHEVARWCRLLADSGIAAEPARLDVPVPPDPAAAGTTVIHPGAASSARRWPEDRWAALARAERSRGHRVLITGSPAEADIAQRVACAARLAPAAVLAGRTDLPALASVIAGARRVVCGDTGIAHLATATRTPSVVLFGPTPPARWGPPSDRPWHRVLWHGRTGDPHAATPDPGLLAITVPQVTAALDDLPLRPRPATLTS